MMGAGKKGGGTVAKITYKNTIRTKKCFSYSLGKTGSVRILYAVHLLGFLLVQVEAHS